MKKPSYENGKRKFFIKLLTIELYYPYIIWNNINFGIRMDTVLLGYKKYPERAWVMDWSIAMQILGFGIGFAYKHCENPNSPNYNG